MNYEWDRRERVWDLPICVTCILHVSQVFYGFLLIRKYVLYKGQNRRAKDKKENKFRIKMKLNGVHLLLPPNDKI